MKQKLIDGYLRELETSLNDQVIPNELNIIIFNYYQKRTLICYLTATHNNPLYIADVTSNEPIVLKSKAEQIDINKASPGYTHPCIGYNISSWLSVDDSSKYNTAIFHCGGYDSGLSKECGAITFHSNNLQTSSSNEKLNLGDIDFTRLTLPNLPKATFANDTVFSNKYGLFSVGGRSSGNEVYNLQKRSNARMKWKKLKNEMKSEHYYPSVCIINDNQLFVAAGYNNNSFDARHLCSKVEICNLENGEWSQLTDCRIKRCIAGIFYDSVEDSVYLGGGDCSSVECYDMNKNIWTSLPDCNFEHKWSPVLWKDDNILYIASIDANRMEFIDLRESNASWTVKHEFDELFNTGFNYTSVQNSWLWPFDY